MSEPEAATEARRWLRYALDDLAIAGHMARDAACAKADARALYEFIVAEIRRRGIMR